MLQIVALVELLLCWIAWSLGFVGPRKQASGEQVTVRATASRLGVVLQAVGIAFVWTYVRPVGYENAEPVLVASMVLGPLSVMLGWAAARRLGKQWRFEAALTEDHELIQSGPYRWVRHPIYASMLGMLLATGAAWSWWPMLVAALIFFIAGTEIRVRAEDRLLAERFGEQFAEYRSRVRAYIPLIR